MKNVTLTILTLIFCISVAQAQKTYIPLKKEDIDFTALMKQYSGDMDIHYIQYKMATTIPENPRKEIDDKYVIKNFDLKRIENNQSKEVLKLLDSINAKIEIRMPKSDEDPNFIYFEANLKNDMDLFLMTGRVETTMRDTDKGQYQTTEIRNLNNIIFFISNSLKKENDTPILLGDKCIVSVNYGKNNDVIILIALELKNFQFKEIDKGSILLKIKEVASPQGKSISKSDLGKTVFIGTLPIKIIEFENGSIHYQYLANNSIQVENLKIIGSIHDKKFNIQNFPIGLLNFSYEKYRKQPFFGYKKFMDYIEPKRKMDIPTSMIETKVEIINIGYDVDSIFVINTKNVIPSNFSYAAMVSKDENSNQKLSTVFRDFKYGMDTEDSDRKAAIIKRYISTNVQYPRSAQEKRLEAIASLRFTISPSGKLTDLVFLNNIEFSFMDAIQSVFRSAPIFEPIMINGVPCSTVITMRVVFKL